MFNSQHINHDPYPIFHTGSGERKGLSPGKQPPRWGYEVAPGYVYEPRPEYDNNPNPILLQYRAVQDEELPYADLGDWLHFLSNPLKDSWKYATVEHVNHARKVLTRLAAIYKEEQQ